MTAPDYIVVVLIGGVGGFLGAAIVTFTFRENREIVADWWREKHPK